MTAVILIAIGLAALPAMRAWLLFELRLAARVLRWLPAESDALPDSRVRW